MEMVLLQCIPHTQEVPLFITQTGAYLIMSSSQVSLMTASPIIALEQTGMHQHLAV